MPDEALPPDERRKIASGAFVWLLLIVALVFLRGVRWDENYEFAQVLLGQIPYPPDHPLAQYVSHFFSAQTYALAFLMRGVSSPLVPNLFRNLIALSAVILPVYLLASTCARKSGWGHVAGLLVLAGIHVPFYGTYPAQVWPGLYTNGMVGQGYALFVIWLFLVGRLRTACVLTGLMPLVHLGQFPPVFLFALLRMGAKFMHERKPPWTACLSLTMALVVSAALYLIQSRMALPVPTSGPFAGALSPQDVFRSFMRHHASHRELPLGTGHIPLIALAVSAFCLPRLTRKQRWLWAYGLILGAIVWGIMLIHGFMGSAIPQVLIGWMPYRLMNHAAPILICVLLAVIAREAQENRAFAAVTVLVLLAASRFFLSSIIPAALYTRYIASGEFAMFGLIGFCLFPAFSEKDRSGMLPRLLPGLSIVILGCFHQFGAVCIVSGLAAAWIVHRIPLDIPQLRYALAATCAALMLHEGMYCEHLPVTSSERIARDYLDRAGDSDSMILVRHQQEGLQARLHRPVMTDMAAMTWIPYYPPLGPGLDKMYRDLYGVRLAPQGGEPVSDQPWYEVWPSRTPEQWRALAAEYGFRYVYAPSFMKIQLPQLTQGDQDSLYGIPD